MKVLQLCELILFHLCGQFGYIFLENMLLPSLDEFCLWKNGKPLLKFEHHQTRLQRREM